jgi:hypothetical protein
LSHRDCVSLVSSCIDADEVPFNFTILYGVSDNKDIVHDLSNPFGWQPKDAATSFFSRPQTDRPWWRPQRRC